MEGTVAPSAIVLEVLNEDNYERWSVWVKTYLLANGLWDVVETSRAPLPSDFEVWTKRNAQALHAIQISCGLDTFTLISEFNSASRAWKTLAETLKPSLPEFLNDPGFEDRAKIFHKYEPFFDAVRKGDWDGTKFLDETPDAITARIPYSGQTALHIATDARQTRIVEKLVKLMPEGSLEIKADDGMTALAVAASKGYTRMAQCMVEKNTKILSIGDAANRIPLVLACRNGHSDMIRYLYVATPVEDLMPEMGPNGATIVSQCFADKKYDLAWSLIQRFPRLAISKDHYGLTPLYALSGVPSAFPSGMKLRLLQRLIYKCINIEATPLSSNDTLINVGNIANGEDNQRDFIGSGTLLLLLYLEK
ncbi:uncharacterized protein LOC112165293 [Rosa chinensis]|uniref:uncharacterized protein LOC112165293 n=1 Tax=Rosa chinensis TaxID=74649 RepID=UPI001AD8EFFF|nr:uncharacterized protein LOC112165293 [Rosa chinensis]